MVKRSIHSGLLDRREFVGAGVMALAGAASIATAEPRDVLKAVAHKLGAAALRTVRFTASGATFTVGQNFTPSDPWPRVSIKTCSAAINYETGSMQLDLVREIGPTMPRGGGVPFSGELHQIQAVSGDYAWNVPVPAPPPQGGAGPATPNTLPEAGGTGWAGPGGSPQAVPEADAYSPPQTPTTPLIPSKIPYAAALYDNIRRLKLDVETIAPFHGLRTVAIAELGKQSGRATALCAN